MPMSTLNDLEKRWRRLVHPQHAAWTFHLIESSYHAPLRHYHTLAHVESCLQLLDTVDVFEGDERVAAELALWFHDLVYVAGDPDNETTSVKILGAVASTLSAPEMVVERAKYCILATRHKETKYYDPLHALVVDIDLSILGAPENEYLEYARDVRQEFKHVSNEAWCVGRSNFLASMLAREKTFSLLTQFEKPARANMQDELDRLGKGII